MVTLEELKRQVAQVRESASYALGPLTNLALLGEKNKSHEMFCSKFLDRHLGKTANIFSRGTCFGWRRTKQNFLACMQKRFIFISKDRGLASTDGKSSRKKEESLTKAAKDLKLGRRLTFPSIGQTLHM